MCRLLDPWMIPKKHLPVLVHDDEKNCGGNLNLDDDFRDWKSPWVVGGVVEHHVRKGRLLVRKVLVNDSQWGEAEDKAEGHQEEGHQRLLKLNWVARLILPLQNKEMALEVKWRKNMLSSHRGCIRGRADIDSQSGWTDQPIFFVTEGRPETQICTLKCTYGSR